MMIKSSVPKLALLLFCMFSLVVSSVYASGEKSKDIEVHVYYKGNEIIFKDMQPMVKDGRTLVPFRKIFEVLGFTVSWNGQERKAVGIKDNFKIELTFDSKTAVVNDQNVTLDVPAQIIGGSTLVPIRFVSESSGYTVEFSSEKNVYEIRIEDSVSLPSDQPTAPDAGTGSAAGGQLNAVPYKVKGYVKDPTGRPLANVQVFADNLLLIDSNLITTTDANGYYEIELPILATTWNISANSSIEYNGKTYNFYSNTDQPFAGSAGAIRNITLEGVSGFVYVYPDIWSLPDGIDPQLEEYHLTLTPVGKLMDGSNGTQISQGLETVYNWYGIKDIPLGKYTATATWEPEGQPPVQLLIRTKGAKTYSESVTFEFKDPMQIKMYMAEFEVQFPN